MAGAFDAIKDKMTEQGELKDRLQELKSKEQAGEIDDKGRLELRNLKERIHKG